MSLLLAMLEMELNKNGDMKMIVRQMVPFIVNFDRKDGQSNLESGVLQWCP